MVRALWESLDGTRTMAEEADCFTAVTANRDLDACATKLIGTSFVAKKLHELSSAVIPEDHAENIENLSALATEVEAARQKYVDCLVGSSDCSSERLTGMLAALDRSMVNFLG